MFICKTDNDELQVVGYCLGFVLDAGNGERKDNLSSQTVFGVIDVDNFNTEK